METTSFDELAARIGEVSAGHGGTLPPDQAAAWAGYIAALLEWGNLPVSDHARLLATLGPGAAAAVVPIFVGATPASESLQPVDLFKPRDAAVAGHRDVARTGTYG